MSRVILSKYPDNGEHFTVGWDHPARGAFWQEWASRSEVSEAERLLDETESVTALTAKIAATGVKREGGMWPGIPLHKFRNSVPEDLRPMVTDEVMALLLAHKADPDSSYKNAVTDLSSK